MLTADQVSDMKIGPELVKSVGDVKIVDDKDYDSKAIRKGTCRSGSFPAFLKELRS